MSEPVVVTGVNGFVGRHLVLSLVASGRRVVGVSRDARPGDDIAGLLVDHVAVDLASDPLPVIHASGVVHLAGLSAVGPSFDHPQHYLTSNTAMMTNVCEPLLAANSPARVVVVSSGAVYDSAQDLPITEAGRTAPTSPYAVSKLAVEHQAFYYARRGLAATVARPFNHIGPGQGPGFLVPDIIAGLKAAQRTGVPPAFGDLTSQRDYTDVRDVADAYVALLNADGLAPGELVNVCTGRAVEGTRILSSLAQIAEVPIDGVTVDASLLRPAEPSVIAGSNARLSRLTGWRPKLTLDQSLADAWAASLSAMS
ncbi:GDP-mannose 4,6-dehydratase [Nocardioides sp. ChNu-153]|uniref:NAD-dependent epimerase/dehydratase family protein n=1 Tax=unclassified Nocardioides TaxID=2615069 RepID=UPI0024054BBE|nr:MULTISPECIES: NAD-dependent epimerase/dehydratase family protein [unclassified Nocardioides]MDF9715027.1 GDP-mannose 4,6-dehydratase [Nocardioides sp. ChNu-99]MDN7122296.1 GDP-mannose 4,6-dehydratase [Nocardioides sp. ChNu-153]